MIATVEQYLRLGAKAPAFKGAELVAGLFCAQQFVQHQAPMCVELDAAQDVQVRARIFALGLARVLLTTNSLT
ncbi:MAG: hypothetical protein GXY61_14275 [Lentisphaerae bacterium]|nr:hypothetical protein [Lentisphaerota bacterium]